MSGYPAFDVLIDNDDGTQSLVPSATVEVRDFTDPDAIVRLSPDLEADTDGHVDTGSLAVDAGSSIRFSWFDTDSGVCGYAEVVTV